MRFFITLLIEITGVAASDVTGGIAAADVIDYLRNLAFILEFG